MPGARRALHVVLVLREQSQQRSEGAGGASTWLPHAAGRWSSGAPNWRREAEASKRPEAGEGMRRRARDQMATGRR